MKFEVTIDNLKFTPGIATYTIDAPSADEAAAKVQEKLAQPFIAGYKIESIRNLSGPSVYLMIQEDGEGNPTYELFANKIDAERVFFDKIKHMKDYVLGKHHPFSELAAVDRHGNILLSERQALESLSFNLDDYYLTVEELPLQGCNDRG